MIASFVRRKWENESRTIATFYFEPQPGYRYEAGQYAVINVPHHSPDSRGTERTMTLSSSPHESLVSITMKMYFEGGSSFKRTLLSLDAGAQVTIHDAMGDLVLPLDASIPLVFIAGGVGIASFVGMMKWLNHTHDARDISLFYAVTQTSDIVLQQPFTDYQATARILHQTYTAASKRMSAADIIPHLKNNSLIYISGTETMVEDIRAQLLATGINSRQIVFDYFDGYTYL